MIYTYSYNTYTNMFIIIKIANITYLIVSNQVKKKLFNMTLTDLTSAKNLKHEQKLE